MTTNHVTENQVTPKSFCFYLIHEHITATLLNCKHLNFYFSFISTARFWYHFTERPVILLCKHCSIPDNILNYYWCLYWPCPVIQRRQAVTSHFFVHLVLHLTLYFRVFEQEHHGKVEGAWNCGGGGDQEVCACHCQLLIWLGINRVKSMYQLSTASFLSFISVISVSVWMNICDWLIVQEN